MIQHNLSDMEKIIVDLEQDKVSQSRMLGDKEASICLIREQRD